MKIGIVLCTYEPNTVFLKEQVDSILSSVGCHHDIYLYHGDDSRHAVPLTPTEHNGLSSINYEYIRGPQQQSASLNFINTISLAKDCDWVFLSDQDDIWHRDKFNEYIGTINRIKGSTPEIIFSDSSLIDSTGKITHESFFKYQSMSTDILESDDILFSNCVQGATLCINRMMIELLLSSFISNEEKHTIVMHDWWIAILVRYFGNWHFIDKPLLMYRQHDKNVIGAIQSGGFISLLRNFTRLYSNLRKIKCQLDLWERKKKAWSLTPTVSMDITKLNCKSRVKLAIIRSLLF